MNDKTTSVFWLFKTACVHALALAVLSATAITHADDNDDDDDDDDNRVLIRTIVPASLGGTFSDDPDNPQITVSIPPGALNVDARLRVVLLADRDDDDDDDEDDKSYSDPNQTPASPVYKVRLTKKRGRGRERTRP